MAILSAFVELWHQPVAVVVTPSHGPSFEEVVLFIIALPLLAFSVVILYQHRQDLAGPRHIKTFDAESDPRKGLVFFVSPTRAKLE